MTAKTIEGDLLESSAQYIVHQCNCVTWNAAHLALSVFRRFPFADIYNPRAKTKQSDTPGDIIICGNGIDERYVLAILGQYYPGRPKYPNSSKDGHKARERYFQASLDKIAQLENLESLAFPWGIGCGAAGGDWPTYREMIDKFAESVQNREVEVTIVRLPGT